MKRILTILLIFGVTVTFFGFRGSDWRGARTVAGEYTFKDSITINKLVVEGAASFEDTIQGNLIINGVVKPKIISFNMWRMGGLVASGTKNTLSVTTYLEGTGGTSFDSLIIDSVYVYANATEDSNKVDSLHLCCYASRTLFYTHIIQDGTDWGSSGWPSHTYTNINITVPATAYYFFKFKPKAESAANKMAIANIILYGHPK